MNLALIALAILGGPALLVGVLAAAMPRKARPRASSCSIREMTRVACGRAVGVVKAWHDTLVAPSSGRRCVFYRYGRQDRIRTRYGAYWTDPDWLPGEVGSVAFMLEDDSAAAIVDLRDAELAMEKVLPIDAGSARALSARHGIDHLVRRDAVRLVEQIVVVGQRLEIVGVATEEADPEAAAHGSQRGAVPTRLRIVGAPPWNLLAADRGQ